MFHSRTVSGEESGIRLHRFLTSAFSSTLCVFFMKSVVKYGHRHTFTKFIITKSYDEVLIIQQKDPN